MGKVIISAGEKLHCYSKEGIIGALIKYYNRKCALTAYHILKAGNCNVGDKINLDEHYGRLEEIREEADLAIISIDASDDEVKISEITTPEIGSAYSLNGFKRIDCRVMTIGRTYHYLAFPMGNLPLPGDSGSPIIQEGKVLGILASIFYNNANGIALSIDRFKVNSEDNL